MALEDRNDAPRRNGGRENGQENPGRPRRRRRKNSGCLTAIIYFAFVVGISTLLAGVGWIAANDVLALNKPEASTVITITKDETLGDIAKQLKEDKIIQHPALFRMFCHYSDAMKRIVPGTYELRADYDYRAIVTAMSYSSASRLTASVTIPEGYTLKQIFTLLQEKGVCEYGALEEMAATHDYNFSFLKDLPLGDATRLEGYLFPDTYEFFLGENPLYVLNKMLVNFDAKVTDAMRKQAVDMGYTLRDIVVIASMIERETTGEDQRTIASVIYNRLGNPTAFPKLQIDATVQYALGEWKTALTYADLQLDSPYNTYKYAGLPAGPIANPGFESIYAALNPEKTGYYYYALDKEGDHQFFKTSDAFQTFVTSQDHA